MTRNRDNIILKYYILPLYSIATDIVKEGYVKAFIDRHGLYLFLDCKDNHTYLTTCPLYDGQVDIKGTSFYMFRTHSAFIKDIEKIIDGRYSKISENARQTIISLCGRPYKQKGKNGKETTAWQLLALLKHADYKKYLENKLGVELDDETNPSTELMDKLTENAFIETLIET